MQLQDLELELDLEVKERPLRPLQLEGNTCQSTSFASPNTTMIDALRSAEQSLRLLPHMLVIPQQQRAQVTTTNVSYQLCSISEHTSNYHAPVIPVVKRI